MSINENVFITTINVPVHELLNNVAFYISEKNSDQNGISVAKLNEILKNNESFKSIFKTEELTNKGVQIIDAYLNSILRPEYIDVKNQFIADFDRRTSKRSMEKILN